MIIFRCISSEKKDMQPYTDIITNKDTIDHFGLHVLHKLNLKKLKHIMVCNTISVEKWMLYDFRRFNHRQKFKELVLNLQQ